MDNNQARNGLRLKDPQVSDPVCVYVSTGWESRVETTRQKELKRGQSGTSDVHREGSMQTDAAGGAQTHIPDSRSVFGLPGSFFGSDATSILSSISRYRLFLPWSSHNTPPLAPLLLHLLALRLCPHGFFLAPLRAFSSSVSTSLLRPNQLPQSPSNIRHVYTPTRALRQRAESLIWF